MSRLAVLLAVAVLGAPSLASAQPTIAPACSYENCAVRHTANFWGERIVRGAGPQQVMKINFTGSNAMNFLARVESAAAPARSYRAKRTRAAILGVISAGASGWLVAKAFRPEDTGSETDITSADLTVLWVGIGTGIVSGIEAVRSRNDLSRAIWEFNRAPIR